MVFSELVIICKKMGLFPEIMCYKDIKTMIAAVKCIGWNEVSSRWLFIDFKEFKDFILLCSRYCVDFKKSNDKKVAKNPHINSPRLHHLKMNSVWTTNTYEDSFKNFVYFIKDKVKLHYNIDLKVSKLIIKSPKNRSKLSSRVDSGSTPMLLSEKSFLSPSKKIQLTSKDTPSISYLINNDSVTEAELRNEKEEAKWDLSRNKSHKSKFSNYLKPKMLTRSRVSHYNDSIDLSENNISHNRMQKRCNTEAFFDDIKIDEIPTFDSRLNSNKKNEICELNGDPLNSSLGIINSPRCSNGRK